MKGIIKYLVWGLGALFALAFVVIAAFALLFDPNALRDDITRVVAQQTGRDLVIEGDLSLSFYPWLGFAAGQTTLSNPAGFDEPVMLRFDSASASVRLLPLLRRRVELSSVTLEGFDLKLHRRADGKSNWDDLVSEDTAEADAESDDGGFAPESIGGIRLRDARIAYLDEQSGDDYLVRDLELETGALQPGKTTALDGAGFVVAADPGVEGQARLRARVRLDADGIYTLTDPRFEIDATGEAVPGDSMRIELSGPQLVWRDEDIDMSRLAMKLSGTGPGDPWTSLDATLRGEAMRWTGFDVFELASPSLEADLQSPELPGGGFTGTMRADSLRASLDKQDASVVGTVIDTLGMRIEAPRILGSRIIDAPTLEATISVAEFSPRSVLAQLDLDDDLEMADPNALGSMRLRADASYTPDAIRLRKLDAKLDDTTMTGSLAIVGDSGLRFDLAIDTIDIDRYRAPSEDTGAADTAAGLEEIEIPVAELRELDLDGKARIGAMQLVGLESTDVSIEIKAAGGNIRVHPARALLYGGAYNGDIRLDVRGEQPSLSLNERLENVQFGPFSKDLLDAERLSGTLNGRMTVAGSGTTAAQITSSANGDAVFKFTDGAYEGTNIFHSVRKARAMLGGKPAPEGADANRTRFADLSGTARITDGTLSSDDISMVLPFMKVRGRGSLQLLSQQVDFRFEGDIVDRPDLSTDVNDLVGITVPLRITGTLSEPSVGVDMAAALASLAKRKLADKLGVGGDGKGDPEQAAKDAVEDKKEQLEDELEDKAKDLLKDLFGGG